MSYLKKLMSISNFFPYSYFKEESLRKDLLKGSNFPFLTLEIPFLQNF